MNSSNSSFATLRRALVAAAVALTAGSTAALAQANSQGSSTMPNNSNDTNYSSSANNSSTTSQNSSDMSANDQSSASSDHTTSEKKLSWGDRHFVDKAADGGQAEVALGQLASEKASNPDVRAFGQRLVQDHQMANSQLEQLAQQKNVKLDNDKSHDRTYRRLSKKSGEDFDREFVDHEVEDHEKDIKMFEKEAKDAKDPDLRSFAEQTLPKLREHLSIAQQLQQSIVPTGREDKTSGRSMKDSSSTNSSNTGASSGSSDMSGHSTNAGTTAGTTGSSTATTP